MIGMWKLSVAVVLVAAPAFADEHTTTTTTTKGTATKGTTTTTTETITDEPTAKTAELNSSVTDKTTYTCSSGPTNRTIEVVYETAGAKVPCKVNYTKGDDPTTGTQAMWSSANTEGFCEEKAKYLADKLTTSGWNCL